MDYESRIQLISRKLNDFLRQFKTPDHLTDEAALQRVRATAEAINKRLPASLDRDGLAVRLGDGFQDVIERHKTREWPAVSAFSDAFDKPAEVDVSEEDEYQRARELWFRRRMCLQGLDSWEIAKRLIADGADPWEIRYGGFSTEASYYDELEANGQGWKGHEAVMEKMRAWRRELGVKDDPADEMKERGMV